MRTFGWVVRGLVLAMLWLLVGCAASVSGRAGVDQTGGTPEPVASEEAPAAATDPAGAADLSGAAPTRTEPPTAIPEGFTAFDTFGYRGLQICPSEKPRCVGIEIFSSADCPAGATVILKYYKEPSSPVTYLGVADSVSSPIAAGGTQQIFIATPPELSDSNPYGYVEAIDC